MSKPELNKIYCGDTLEVLKTWPDEFVDCIVSSPPYYGLRNYGVEGQIGLEPTLSEYLDKMLLVTAELKRVLKKTGTMWWNHGDSYNAKPPGNSLENQLAKHKMGDGVFGRLGDRNRGKNYRYDQYKLRGATGPEKSLTMQAHRLAIRMIDEQQWILRNCLIWHKPNVMPSSVKDRFTVDYEPVFFFTKSKKYWFETQYEPAHYLEKDKRAVNGASMGGKAMSGNYAINKGGAFAKPETVMKNGLLGKTETLVASSLGRNKRSVWKISTKPYKEAHFATFPPALIETPIKAGCPPNGICLDPFMGSGTTAYVARQLERNYLGIELNEEYIKLAENRLAQNVLI